MSLTKAIRAGDLLVFINNKPFGVCTGIRWATDVGLHALHGIDQTAAFELATGTTAVKGTIDCIRVRTQSGLEAAGVSVPEDLVLRGRYFSLVLIDRVRDAVILEVPQAASGGEAWQVNSRGELTGSFSFEGLGWAHELSR